MVNILPCTIIRETKTFCFTSNIWLLIGNLDIIKRGFEKMKKLMKRGLSMANMRKLLSFILAAVIVIMSLSSVAYAKTETVDIDKIADSLNKLNILQGSNGNYLLNNNITRAEATALIIRMLGKENYVKENAEQLKHTKYLDVEAKQWYAPYVGYSDLQSIVAGNPDGTFTPTDNVSEKAFIKMALCAIGYEYGSDFDWTNVYQKAYEVGIVTGDEYIEKTQDDYDYKRKKAAEVIFRSLNTYKKGTQTKMAYTLVEEGVVTSAELAASGIFGDDILTKVEISRSLSPNSIEVKFNEKIQSIDIEDVEIRIWDVGEQELPVASVVYIDNTVQIITGAQLPGKAYNVTFKKIVDESGNIASDITCTFIGYIPQQVSSDLFKVQKVEQASSNVINVYYTHPVNINSETPAYYEIYENGNLLLTGSAQNMTVRKMQSNDNAVSIYLNNKTLQVGQMYTLKISGKLTSAYGVKLAEGYGEIRDFTAAVDQSGQLQVTSVQAMTHLTVKVIFNREIDTDWAAKRLNYTVYDVNKRAVDVTNAVVTTTGTNSGKEVLLTLAYSLDRTKQYELKIEYIPDVYKQSSIENKTVQFSGAYLGDVDLNITNASSDYNNIIVLNFNKPLDESTATKVSNYVVSGMTDTSFNVVPEKAYYSENGSTSTVKLFLGPGKNLTRSYRYMVYVSNITDSVGTIRSVLMRREFTAGGSTVLTPAVTDAVIISGDTVKLAFNMEMAFSQNNLNPANYVMEYIENNEVLKIAPVGVTYIDAKTLVLRFDELNPQSVYRLRYNKITDFSETYTGAIPETVEAVNVRWGK